MNILGIISDSIGIIGAIFSLLAWWKARQIQQQLQMEKERMQQKITVVLQCGARIYELPVKIPRSSLSRAEVLGILGMVPLKERGKRFTIDYVSTKDFIDEINNLIVAQGNKTIRIICTPEELEKFDFDAFQYKRL